MYIGETKRPLDVRIKEHRTHTQKGETSRSGIADHAWENQHQIQWSEAQIIHNEQHWKKRKFIEAAYIKNNTGVFSKPSVEIPNLWQPLLTTVKSLQVQRR